MSNKQTGKPTVIRNIICHQILMHRGTMGLGSDKKMFAL